MIQMSNAAGVIYSEKLTSVACFHVFDLDGAFSTDFILWKQVLIKPKHELLRLCH